MLSKDIVNERVIVHLIFNIRTNEMKYRARSKGIAKGRKMFVTFNCFFKSDYASAIFSN